MRLLSVFLNATYPFIIAWGRKEYVFFGHIHKGNYLKQANLIVFSPEEADQSTQERFTTKIPRTTELAKTTQGNPLPHLWRITFPYLLLIRKDIFFSECHFSSQLIT